jgi:class 3 adenylate cyclase/tetratricopeptide (TPR) repeat protein
MKCPECQTENPEGKKFCRRCGIEMKVVCPRCGAMLQLDDTFCGDCGFKIEEAAKPQSLDYAQPQSYTPKFLSDKILTSRSSIEGERKLVTVLFADVANFTSMSEKLDPEEVHQIMDGCFKILMDEIHKSEGTINQFTGDGVMALFGAPVAHEDHAQRACHAALSIQSAMGEYGDKVSKDCGVEFQMRIGINSGPVIVGAIGDDLRMDYTALGDTTNLASRIERMAQPGTVLLSKHTRRLVNDYFDLNPLGKLELKGKGEPQEVFELVKAGGAATRLEAAAARGLTKFVGRENSMAALTGAFEKVKNGTGQLVGIVGEAGVGKSRLLYEFRSRLPRGDFRYLEGRCIHYGRSMPYLPILDILRSYFEIGEGEREILIRKRIKEKVTRLEEKLQGILPPIQEILSLKVNDEAYSKLEPKRRKEKIFEALRDLLVGGGKELPLVFAIEDLHWIDKTSEEFLNYLIGWMAPLRVMLVLLYRPEYAPQWGNKSYFNRISVDQLSVQSSAELVKAILKGGEAAPELNDLILNRAAGNPFFMEELTHTLLENGSIRKEENQYVLAGRLSSLQVPETVQGIIAARIDRLEENLKRIMQVASVIGREFAFRILQAISGVREDLKSQLLNLQGLEFIYEKNLFPELEYIFKHALTQEVAYNSVLLKRRKEIHEKIGDAIEKLYAERLEEFYQMLAYHYSKSENIEKACKYSKLSGDKAEKIFSHWEALSFYKNALDSLNKVSENRQNQEKKLEIVKLAHRAIGLLGMPVGSLEIYEEGIRLSRELGYGKDLVVFFTSIANYHSHRGNAKLGLSYSTHAFEEAQRIQDVKLMVPSAWGLVVAYMSIGDYEKILNIAPDVIGLIEREGRKSDSFGMPMNPYSVLCTYCGLSMGNSGYFEEGKAFFEKALRNVSEFKDISVVGAAELAYGTLLVVKGDWGLALEHLKKGIKYTEVVKWFWVSALSRTCLGLAYVMIGELETGRLNAKEGLNLHRSTGVEMHLPASHYFSSFVYMELGELGTARSLAEEALRLAQKCNDKSIQGRSMLLLGKVLGISGAARIDEVEDLVAKGLQVLKGLGATAQYSLGYLFLGEVYLKAAKTEMARENLMKAEGMFQKMGMDFWLTRTRELLDRI